MIPRLTPSQTVGPYLAIGLPWEHGPVADPAGVRISGRVLDGAGDPVPDALVETWDPRSRAFARCPTDDEGSWFVVTPTALMLVVNVLARGLLHRLVTRVYFALDPEDEVLARVPADRRATLLAERVDDGFRFDIRIWTRQGSTAAPAAPSRCPSSPLSAASRRSPCTSGWPGRTG